MADPSAMATVQIAASPNVVYGLITDLPTLASLAEEAVAMERRKGNAVRQGAEFIGHNASGSRRWSMRCTVTDAELGRLFAFDVRHTVIPIARWQYDIVAADGGCRVTESTWDRRPVGSESSPAWPPASPIGWPRTPGTSSSPCSA